MFPSRSAPVQLRWTAGSLTDTAYQNRNEAAGLNLTVGLGQVYSVSWLEHRNLVLVIDDDPGMLKGVHRLSGSTHTSLSSFLLGRSLHESTRSNLIDFEKVVCLIVDINLKDGSGIELRYRLKADGVSVPVIYMTGNEDPTVRRAALESGCIAFLPSHSHLGN